MQIDCTRTASVVLVYRVKQTRPSQAYTIYCCSKQVWHMVGELLIVGVESEAKNFHLPWQLLVKKFYSMDSKRRQKHLLNLNVGIRDLHLG